MDERGNIYASMQEPGTERAQIAMLQVERRDELSGLDIARTIVRAKMKHQFGILKYFAKYNGGDRAKFRTTLDDNKPFLNRMIKKSVYCFRENNA